MRVLEGKGIVELLYEGRVSLELAVLLVVALVRIQSDREVIRRRCGSCRFQLRGFLGAS